MIKFYNFWLSSASFRVRIGLYLKDIPFENIHIHIRKEQGEQFSTDYQKINPQNLVPALELENGKIITQSLVILDYIDANYNKNPISPQDSFDKSLMQSLSHIIALDIQPINNLRIIKYLKSDLSANEEQTSNWTKHWIDLGFKAFEENLKSHNCFSKFCIGDTPTIADICLIPQIYNAKLFKMDMKAYPIISQIYDNCLELEAFNKALPENQPDAEL